MTEFSIEYNPYRVKCCFKKNGKFLNSANKIQAKADSRLQAILSPSTNWSGLAEEIVKTCNDSEIKIVFRGRRIDFDDLKYCIDEYKGSTHFSLEFTDCKNDNDIISELDGIFSDIKGKNLPQFSKVDENGRNIFTAYEESKNGRFEVSVIATMSSGKSTLINSLLHTELLPSENRACTATIAQILDNDDMDHYEAECLNSEREVIYPRTNVTLENIKQFNADEAVRYINIEGSIPAIPSDKIRLCLRDTPGPNNSRNENHGAITRSIIKDSNAVVLYVMNAENFAIKDDKNLLQDIASEMKRSGKQSRDRFIFVLNKCDVLDEEKGETVELFLRDVRDYLKGFGIIDPILIPTSAELALLIRKTWKGEKLSRKQENAKNGNIDRFISDPRLHFEKYATLTPSIREKLANQVERSCETEDKEEQEAIIHSGIPAVEETITEYIEKYAYPIKVYDAIHDIVAILEELDMKSKFDNSIAEDSDRLEKVREQIALAKKKHDDGNALYGKFKSEIEAFSIDDSVNEKNEIFRLESELSEITEQYSDLDKVDKDDAINLIEHFKKTITEYQSECECRLRRAIEDELFKKCSDMLSTYKNMVRGILEEIEIDGFDFGKLSEFSSLNISGVDDVMKRNESVRMKTETRTKKNPEREGFFGWLKFWKPWEITYEVKVKDGINVNVKKVILDSIGTFRFSISQNISNMLAQARQQVTTYKDIFNKNIDKLEDGIGKVLKQLEAETKESSQIESRVKENKELSQWVTETEKRIRTILDF